MKNWYAVITAEVLYDKELKPQEKILIAVINNLRNETSYCFASNDYLSKILNISIRNLQKHLQILEDKGYVSRVIELHSSGEVKNRFLSINETKITPMSKTTPPHVENDTHNNKVNNINIVTLYNLYPTKCPTKGNRLQKSKKDKVKLKSLLKSEYTFDKLKNIIEKYASDCKTQKTYMKHFKTFLNNIPDYEISDTVALKKYDVNSRDYQECIKQLNQ